MFSLASLYYRNIFAATGGPIATINSGALPVFDTPVTLANAYLRPELASKMKAPHAIYGSSDGSGTSQNPAVARHIAISEALERWAFYATREQGDRRYGFDRDRTSNGMAAFPGFPWQARHRARLEALERFALIGWWDARFPSTVCKAPYPDVGLVRIQHGLDFGEVVVLYHKSASGHAAYGYAAGSTMASATSRAAVELVRCMFVLAQHRARGALAQPVTDPFERRCLHYASPEGFAEFLDRVYSSPSKPAPRWRVLFDGAIPGPWSQWATVWRHAVDQPSWDFMDRRAMCFFW